MSNANCNYPAERLLIFVRAPRPGAVKTRLAAQLGKEGAAAAYRLLADRVIENLASLRDVELHFTPADARAEIAPWLHPSWVARPQVEGDLGARMHAAFMGAFEGGAEKVVLIGSDCPAVAASDVRAAWTALETSSVVLGPALDGGYWLIGLRQPEATLFKNIRWSTENVLSQSEGLAHQIGLTTHRLRSLPDIDTPEDWFSFLAKDQGAA